MKFNVLVLNGYKNPQSRDILSSIDSVFLNKRQASVIVPNGNHRSHDDF